MILVDSSVVIEYLRAGNPRLVALFQSHHAAICGVTRAEVLNGARSQANRAKLIVALDSFDQVSVADTIWDEVGDNLAALRRAGVSVPFADTIIATVAIEYDVELWTRDAQFAMMQRVLPKLKLFQEPP